MQERQRLTLREAMLYANDMARKSSKPECYRWIAIWWRLSAKESKSPQDKIRQSNSQLALYRDMKARPEHYISINRPPGMSDWQWSGLVL